MRNFLCACRRAWALASSKVSQLPATKAAANALANHPNHHPRSGQYVNTMQTTWTLTRLAKRQRTRPGTWSGTSMGGDFSYMYNHTLHANHRTPKLQSPCVRLTQTVGKSQKLNASSEPMCRINFTSIRRHEAVVRRQVPHRKVRHTWNPIITHPAVNRALANTQIGRELALRAIVRLHPLPKLRRSHVALGGDFVSTNTH